MTAITTLNDGHVFIDQNGNRANLAYWGSAEAAEESLRSLENCQDCIDCQRCQWCVSCTRCVDCVHCIRQRDVTQKENLSGWPWPVTVLGVIIVFIATCLALFS